MGNQNSSGVFSPEMTYRIGGTRTGSETYVRSYNGTASGNPVDNVYVYESSQGVGAQNIPLRSVGGTLRGQRAISRANLILEGQPPSNQQLPSQQQPVIKCGTKQTNLVNLRKSSLKLVKDEVSNLHVLQFTFDSLVNGTLTVYYFAVDRTNYQNFSAICMEPIGYREPRTKHFTPDFHKYSEEDILYQNGSFYPLVIVLKVNSIPEEPSLSKSTNSGTEMAAESQSNSNISSQITFATFSKSEEHSTTEYGVSVIKQYAQIGDSLYMLDDIYGYDATFLDEALDDTNLCVICMLNESDTLLLPCRHLCMCAECADRLRVRSNKCPVCRQLVEWMLQIQNLDKTPTED
ncbi:Probable E3 ubiquitin-protein ligase LUL4 [Galdieria sulphuraria]|nr:Probable E3 ubiquitin-protein ligase LUL4 [Galdieria sulphuraria]